MSGIRNFANKLRRSNLRQVLFLALFACAGVTMLILTRAATPTKSTEAESGCREGPASVSPDTTASGGQYLQFGSQNSVTSLPSCYELVWEEPFNGTQLNQANWNIITGGPKRDAYYIPDTIAVNNGVMTLSTFTENNRTYTGMITTQNKYMPKYGYMEARVDLDNAPGMWSAFWVHTRSVSVPGDARNNGVEMDIFEYYVRGSRGEDLSDTAVSGNHWDGYKELHKSLISPRRGQGLGLATGYHTYAMEWTPTYTKYYIDGQYQYTINDSPSSPISQRHQYIILSSEVESPAYAGTTPAGGYGNRQTSTTKMKVDYVRTYQKNPTVPPAPSNVYVAAGQNRNSLIWAVTANATGYKIKRATSPNGPFATIATNGFIDIDGGNHDQARGRLGYYDNNVIPGTTYYYQVVATNGKGDSAPTSVSQAYPGLNLARGRTGSVNDSTAPTRQAPATTDGDHATGWGTNNGDGQWLYLDLGSPQNIGGARLYWGLGFAKTYTLSVSDDANTWRNIYTTQNGDGNLDVVNFSQTRARYVRIQVTQKGQPFEYGYHLDEFELYTAQPN